MSAIRHVTSVYMAVRHLTGLASVHAAITRRRIGRRASFSIPAPAITIDHVAQALASFVRTLVAADSPFDRYDYGGDKKALSPSAIRGLELFQGRARCAQCHQIGETSALLADNQFHSLGVGYSKIEPHLAEITMRSAAAFR